MAVEAHITELQHRHKALETKIESERSHPSADSTAVAELKRKKLILKDEINRLQEATS